MDGSSLKKKKKKLEVNEKKLLANGYAIEPLREFKYRGTWSKENTN